MVGQTVSRTIQKRQRVGWRVCGDLRWFGSAANNPNNSSSSSFFFGGGGLGEGGGARFPSGSKLHVTDSMISET